MLGVWVGVSQCRNYLAIISLNKQFYERSYSRVDFTNYFLVRDNFSLLHTLLFLVYFIFVIWNNFAYAWHNWHILNFWKHHNWFHVKFEWQEKLEIYLNSNFFTTIANSSVVIVLTIKFCHFLCLSFFTF